MVAMAPSPWGRNLSPRNDIENYQRISTICTFGKKARIIAKRIVRFSLPASSHPHYVLPRSMLWRGKSRSEFRQQRSLSDWFNDCLCDSFLMDLKLDLLEMLG